MKMSMNNNRSIFSGVNTPSTTSLKTTMTYYGLFGSACTWSQAYGQYRGKQFSGSDISFEEKVPLGAIVTFFGGVGYTCWSKTPYFRLTVKINGFDDTGDVGDRDTTLDFMYLGWLGIGKLEASSNVKLIHSCRYGKSLQTRVEMWSGETKTMDKAQNALEVCEGERPPKEL
eukprot:Nk52_evm1s525 gene=Nk52_evmTU1s525